MREHKLSFWILWNVCHAVESLQEKVGNLNWMRGRAYAVVDLALVRNVAVVSLVQVDAIPTALVVDLSAHAVGTVGVKHVGPLWRLIIF